VLTGRSFYLYLRDFSGLILCYNPLMATLPENNDLTAVKQAAEQLDEELSRLFGRDTVEQACLLDIADINLSDKMVQSISDGMTRLKQSSGNIKDQRNLIQDMAPGERLLLCMWVREMELLEKIRGQ